MLFSSGAGVSPFASYTSVLIRPTGAGPWTITGTPVTGRGVIELNGADNVTIDGDIAGGSVGRDLTITCACYNRQPYLCSTCCGAFTFAALGSANGNIIRNCNINGNGTGRNVSTFTSTTNVENSSFGLYLEVLLGLHKLLHHLRLHIC
ncbi:MAG: hypothetical protein IPK25_19215 [Saprospiraceae bacterium]|nr:hypothetical protein [Saprospiraceae bacterium]